MLYGLLADNIRPSKQSDIDRISNILNWEPFREYHQFNCSWETRDILKAIENRSPGSVADKNVEEFRAYCLKSGKEFPDVSREPAGGMSMMH
jgi:hypothetical protein